MHIVSKTLMMPNRKTHLNRPRIRPIGTTNGSDSSLSVIATLHCKSPLYIALAHTYQFVNFSGRRKVG
ncbi:hypothetical protein VNO77_33423 [Canavalia gladiata]|uniref:Uncharacterized protein n=1 Tax=Canavalia gladiata TaxID=3824 RepID=A0AAN9KEP5_CANGL